MKLYNYFKDSEEKRLEEEVKNLTPEHREHYLERIADYYLAMEDYSKILDEMKEEE